MGIINSCLKKKLCYHCPAMDLKEVNSGKSIINRHPWERARLAIIKKLLRKELNKKERITILDIGSGDMFVAGSIAEVYLQPQIICVDTGYKDMQTVMASNVLQVSGIDQVKTVLTDTVDIVLLLDVIEHIEDEVSFLKDLLNENYITSATKFIITVPAFQSLFSAHDSFLGHYRRYSRKILLERLSQAGLKTSNYAYFFFSLLLPRKWSQLRKRKYAVNKPFTGIGNWKGGKIITAIITAFLVADYKLSVFLRNAGIKLPGLSLYAVCQKLV